MARRSVPDEQMTFGWGPVEAVPGAVLPRAHALSERLRALAERKVFIGTSSWKYHGWLGQVYHPARYQVRRRFSASRFNDQCLGEYARIFSTVCGDFTFYQFPSPQMWADTFAQLPPAFKFGLKVPEEVTCERFPTLPRYGQHAGEVNPHFMDAAMTVDRLLAPLEPYREKLGPLIFEFGAIHSRLHDPQAFTQRLDEFLGRLPLARFTFSVEVRNPEFLAHPGYFDCLRAHQVAHCLNSWTRMPPIEEQLRLPGVFTAPHVVGRFLLRPGRGYQQAVEQFSPYERIQDPYPEGRAALGELIASALPDERTVYAYVNNRFEGNAIETIEQAVPPENLFRSRKSRNDHPTAR